MSQPYTGQPCRLDDGRWENRVRAGNNKIVLGSHNQTYENEIDALAVLVHLLHGGPHVIRRPNEAFARGTIGAWMKRRNWPRRTRPYVGTWYRRDSDGRWEARVIAQNPTKDIVFTSVVQGYENERDVIIILEKTMLHGPHVVKNGAGETIPLGSERPTRRQLRKAVAKSAPASGGTL